MEFLTLQNKRAINKAIKDAGQTWKPTYKKARQLKSGSILIPEMWCGVALQFILIKPEERLMFAGQVEVSNGRAKFLRYKQDKPINF